MMDWSTSTMVGRSMGIDVAWGDTSKFAIRYYSIQKQKGGSILCRELRETVDERDHQSYHAAKAEASYH